MTILYHGSNTTIEKIDLSKSRPFKDFGRAFYLSADKQQAWDRAYAAITMRGGTPQVTAFEFDEQELNASSMSILRFESYTEAWADFVFANRNRRKPVYRHNYDIVYGPIANDKVGEQVALLKGGYIDKQRFMQKLQHMRGITFQYAFCTEQAITKLKRI